MICLKRLITLEGSIIQLQKTITAIILAIRNRRSLISRAAQVALNPMVIHYALNIVTQREGLSLRNCHLAARLHSRSNRRDCKNNHLNIYSTTSSTWLSFSKKLVSGRARGQSIRSGPARTVCLALCWISFATVMPSSFRRYLRAASCFCPKTTLPPDCVACLVMTSV